MKMNEEGWDGCDWLQWKVNEVSRWRWLCGWPATTWNAYSRTHRWNIRLYSPAMPACTAKKSLKHLPGSSQMSVIMHILLITAIKGTCNLKTWWIMVVFMHLAKHSQVGTKATCIRLLYSSKSHLVNECFHLPYEFTHTHSLNSTHMTVE